MNDWDDLRFFLAVARRGSIRGAAALLDVNHSTVSRRIDAFEKKLGTRLFERLPSGYFMTHSGEEMRLSAESIEAEFHAIGRRVVGYDARPSGLLRVTLLDAMAQKLLMADIVRFNDAHPGIELELIVSDSIANLSKREADVAIRISNDPPDNLVGRTVVKLATASYASVDYLARHALPDAKSDLTWIGWDSPVSDPQWVRDGPYPEAPARNRINSSLLQLEAAKAGMGMVVLPCFLGDPERTLRRITPATATPSWEIWLLTHEDLRRTARVRLFMDFMANAILAKKDLLEGRCPQ
ncbi:MAG: DNA-binding transcriptional LysR family regulator [Gammaproteobacteria bacterium]|jgi:DNA-binding transcriptional LysR family regulator